MTEEVKVTQAIKELHSGWASNPDAAAIGMAVATHCSQFKANGKPKAPERFAVIYQGAAMGAHQALQSTAEVAAQRDALLEALEFLADAAGATKRFSSPLALGQARTAIAKAKGE